MTLRVSIVIYSFQEQLETLTFQQQMDLLEPLAVEMVDLMGHLHPDLQSEQLLAMVEMVERGEM